MSFATSTSFDCLIMTSFLYVPPAEGALPHIELLSHFLAVNILESFAQFIVPTAGLCLCWSGESLCLCSVGAAKGSVSAGAAEGSAPGQAVAFHIPFSINSFIK